ncbi:MAG: hypothetical protein HN383_13435 [Verrucomicrobia bacterium]|jgi:type II secretory pathway component GspD/PulD (secretin)|nr:hypothetical protein [Verrucomicrobiota bacterium]MBT7700384.1 hypothetical protein [Verrucomicrobiota bacterium]
MKTGWVVWMVCVACLAVVGCDSGGGGGDQACVTLGREAVSANERVIDTVVRQVSIEARIVAVRDDNVASLGIDFSQLAAISSDSGGSMGSSSDDRRDLVVPSTILGGADGLQYIVPRLQASGDFSGYATVGFTDPYWDMKPFVQLPFDSCVAFLDGTVSEPVGFAGLPSNLSLSSRDGGYGGGSIAFATPTAAAVNAALEAVRRSAGNVIIAAPRLSLHSGQRAACIVSEYQPTMDQLRPDFRSAVARVSEAPFQLSTGLVLDVTPTIADDGRVELSVRLGTEGVSASLSTPFDVGGVASDMNVPMVQPGRDVATVTVAGGGTVVLGGLRRRGSELTESGVPVMGDIPILGTLFRSTGLDEERQSLLIFITPTIVEPR